MTKLYLLVVALGLVPVALSYGVNPAAILPRFMSIKIEGTDQTHILRALMCLYLGMSTFCVIAAFTPEWQHVAVIWAVFFMFSLAVGRAPASSSTGCRAGSSTSILQSRFSPDFGD